MHGCSRCVPLRTWPKVRNQDLRVSRVRTYGEFDPIATPAAISAPIIIATQSLAGLRVASPKHTKRAALTAHTITQARAPADRSLEGVSTELMIAGDKTVGSTQLRVRIRFGLSGACGSCHHAVPGR